MVCLSVSVVGIETLHIVTIVRANSWFWSWHIGLGMHPTSPHSHKSVG